MLRRNHIIIPGLLGATIRKPLQLPNKPATVAVRSSFGNVICRATRHGLSGTPPDVSCRGPPQTTRIRAHRAELRNGHGIQDRLHSSRYKLTDEDRGSHARSSREDSKAFSWCSSNVVAIPHAGGTAIPAACAKLAPAIFTIHAAANGWGPGKIAFYRLIAFNTVVVVILVPVVASKINGSSRGSRSSSTSNSMRNSNSIVIEA